MARISDISVKQVPHHYSLSLRRTIDFMKEYADFADKALDSTGAYMEERGVFPISGPVACFHNRDLDRLDVEMGWQIAEPVAVESTEDITCSPVQAHRVVTAIDSGPYEEQDSTLEELLAWAEENGYEPQGPIRYCYLNDTDRPSSEYLTLMMLPIV